MPGKESTRKKKSLGVRWHVSCSSEQDSIVTPEGRSRMKRSRRLRPVRVGLVSYADGKQQ